MNRYQMKRKILLCEFGGSLTALLTSSTNKNKTNIVGTGAGRSCDREECI